MGGGGCAVERKLCYLFTKSLVSWRGRKHKLSPVASDPTHRRCHSAGSQGCNSEQKAVGPSSRPVPSPHPGTCAPGAPSI